MTAAEKRLQDAQARFDRDKHGKNAFIGSTAWGAYQAARNELEAADWMRRMEVAVLAEQVSNSAPAIAP